MDEIIERRSKQRGGRKSSYLCYLNVIILHVFLWKWNLIPHSARKSNNSEDCNEIFCPHILIPKEK